MRVTQISIQMKKINRNFVPAAKVIFKNCAVICAAPKRRLMQVWLITDDGALQMFVKHVCFVVFSS